MSYHIFTDITCPLFWGKFKDYGFEVMEMEIARERVHILLSFPPSRSIGKVVIVLKSKSVRVPFHEFSFLKKKLWSGELWEDGYFVRTIGDRMTRSVIEAYVKNHKDITHGPAQLEMKLR